MNNKRFGQRAMCMLLALIMVVSIVPASLLVIAEEDYSHLIGYWVEFNKDSFYMYKEPGSGGQGFYKSELPEYLEILDVKTAYYGTSLRVYYKLGLIDDATTVNDFYTHTWIWEKDVNLVEPPKPETNPEGYIEGQVGLVMDGEVVTQLTLDRGQKEYVFTQLGDQIQGTPSYQWQIKLDDGRWANIADYIYPYAVLSEALIANNSSESGAATLRCIVTGEDAKYVSGTIDVAKESSVSTFAMARNIAVASAEEPAVDANTPDVASIEDAFQIVVKYNYRHMNAVVKDWDGQAAANTFTITLPAGGSYTGDISSPPVAGYLPYVTKEFKDYITAEKPSTVTYDGVEYYLAESLSFSEVNSKTELQVYYIPQQVNFRVYIYEQNLQDDEYSLAKTDIKTGIADAAVGKGLDIERTGFSALFYDDTISVSSDGMTVVEIYYDRNYYLVDFRYGQDDGQDVEDAYGATPYYVRYNSQVMLPAPTRPGYTLTEWRLDSVYNVDKNGDEIEVSQATIRSQYDVKDANKIITVQHNVDYTAVWEKATSSYTIVYWLENADNDKYDVWYTYRVSVKTGDQTIVGEDNIKDYVTEVNGFTYAEALDVTTTYPYLTFSSTDTTTKKTVSGNGKTTVNIYYDRKEYTFKFYYAIQDVQNSLYYVIGGSTDGFAETNNSNDLTLIAQYAPGGGWSGQSGTVGLKQDDGTVAAALPTLNAEGTARPYTKSSDTSGNYKYHFISFTAKYGADITNLWPCAVFDSVICTEKNTSNPKNGWTGNVAVVSGWTGEYNVKYSRDNYNNTIKGNYTRVDENLLWQTGAPSDNTIAFACFWENGAEGIGWNVPKLFRYNIYFPLLDGQSTVGLTTRTYNGVQYYRYDYYDTCDNSNAGEQTQPGLVGFTANGRESAAISNYDTSVYASAVDMFFYYSRNNYNITFNDMHGNSKTVSVPYGTDLSQDAYKGYIPNYPSAFEDGEARFVGWHSDEAYQYDFVFDNATMPAKNIQLYAEWETLSYNYEVYLDPEQTLKLSGDTLEFNSQIPEPDYKTAQAGNPEYASLIFAGWYYKDESNEEKRFDFNTMTIKHNLTIYAKWTSRVPVEYTVRYVIKNSDGSLTDIADPTVGVSLAGITKSFKAKVNTELYDGYREGYFPDYHTHSMTMSNSEDNTCLFVYTQPTEVDYTITHIFKNDEFSDIFDSNTLTYTQNIILSGNNVKQEPAHAVINFQDGVNKDTIAQAVYLQTGKTLTNDQKTELWEIITQMSPDSFEQDVYIATVQHSEVVFNWTDRGSVGIYQVVHYFKGLDGVYVADYRQQFVANVDDTVSAKPITMYGFEYKQNHEYEVVSGTVANGMNGLILRLYYDRETYNYTVHHYKQNTTVKLAEDTSGSILFEGTVNIAAEAQEISGYDLYNGSENVQIVNKGQEIICYYSGQDVYYRYQTTDSGGYLNVYNSDTVVGKQPLSTTLTLMPGYRFMGWYYTVDDNKFDVPSSWLSNSNMTLQPPAPESEWANKTIYVYAEVIPTAFTITNLGVTDSEQGIIYVITSKESGISVRVATIGNTPTTIQGMPEGQYTVSVESEWSWRYTSASADVSCMTVNGNSNLTWDLSFDGEESVNITYSDVNQSYVSANSNS